MLSQHIMQSLIPIYAETPAVSTGYEYMIGEYSTGYKKSDSKLKVYKKIEKYPGYIYTLITYDAKKNEYGIIQREEVKNLAEEFGYRWNNEVLDTYQVGSTIPKDEVYSKSPVFDEHMNYRYGVNAKIAYVISQETIEDAVTVSESFAKKLSTTYVEDCLVPLNENDMPLNLYGDSKNYKSFPDIGEKTKHSIIFASRRRNKATDQYNMKNSNLRKILPNDDVFQMAGNYIIADLNIWCNKPIDELPNIPAYDQVRKYLIRLTEYYTNIYEEFGRIIDSGANYTSEFSRLYAKARDFLDPCCKYEDEDRIFSNIEMEFTFYRYEKLSRGCKICGRYGNKSVCSRVLPDEEMGVLDDGTPIDIHMDALGILGRLNTGQCYEQELNWIAETVKNKIIKKDSLKDKYKLLYKFLDIAAPDEAEKMRDFLADKDKEFLKDYMDRIENDRIYIIQSPIYSITGDDLVKLYKEFSPEMQDVTYVNEYGESVKAIRPIIVGEEYIMRLKQEPVTKFSVRSKSLTNPRTGMPCRSTLSGHKRRVYSDQCKI